MQQGVKKTHLYLDETIFCEGQAYVALSRAQNAESVHKVKFNKCAFKTNMEIVDLLNYAKKYKTIKNFVPKKGFDKLDTNVELNLNKENSIETVNKFNIYNSIFIYVTLFLSL